MIENGELTVKTVRDSHLREPEARGEEHCTRSQLLRFLDRNGQWIVEGHQYLRQDGTIGGSGKLDPKRLRHEGRILVREDC